MGRNSAGVEDAVVEAEVVVAEDIVSAAYCGCVQ
jgi:hypothetical protein